MTHGALRGRRRGGRRDDRGHDQPASWRREKLLPNASYFAFTATPKNKTLEIFGEPYHEGGAGQAPALPQLHDEAGDPGGLHPGRAASTTRRSRATTSWSRRSRATRSSTPSGRKKKLRRYVESHDHAIRLKAEIMVDHFHEQVLALNKIGGQARAMVVTERHRAGHPVLPRHPRLPGGAQEPVPGHRRLLGRARVRRREGDRGVAQRLPQSSQIADKIQEDPYRFLICADKFQTGYDEPLLHTMYVDKMLSGIKAVQTLSRLNRAHPQKHDVFVLDFMNDADTIQEAFADYYRTTILSEETDPNKLHDLKAALDGYQVYAAGAGRRARGAVPRRRGPRPARPDPRRLRRRLQGAARRGRAGRLQGQGQGVRAHLRLPRRRSCRTPTPSGRSSRSSSTSSCPSCRRRWRRTCRRASSKRSTWTATGSRSRRR